jgi:hypothetical protein
MLIPRFTIRWLLLLTVACALVAMLASMALKGSIVAISMTIALGGAVGMILLYAIVFCVAWGAAKLWRQFATVRSSTSPFATHTLPPQLLRPDEPD